MVVLSLSSDSDITLCFDEERLSFVLEMFTGGRVHALNIGLDTLLPGYCC